MEKFRNDLEKINFPMHLIEAAPLEDILLKPGIGRLRLLLWCLLNISDSVEEEECLLIKDDQLQNRVLKMAVNYGLCSKAEDHQNVFLGVDGNVKHQTAFWDKMFDCVKATKGSEDAIEHTLENCGKSSQFIHELMNSSDFKESLNMKMNLIPADMQIHMNGVPSGMNGASSGVNGASSGVNGASSGVNGTESEDDISEEDRMKWMQFPIDKDKGCVLVENINQLDVECESVTDRLQAAQRTFHSTYDEEFAPITSLIAPVASPSHQAQCAELAGLLTRVGNLANQMMQCVSEQNALVDRVTAVNKGMKTFLAIQENCENTVVEQHRRLRTICHQYELNKTYN